MHGPWTYESGIETGQELAHIIVIRCINTGLEGFCCLVMPLGGRYEEAPSEAVVCVCCVLMSLCSSHHGICGLKRRQM